MAAVSLSLERCGARRGSIKCGRALTSADLGQWCTLPAMYRC
jgi:hypothetical protein